MRPQYSLVIPAYNEEDYLPRLLDSVDAARRRFHGGPDAIEVIVADNASTDATATIAEKRGCRVASVEKRVIAAARNGGAAIAEGEVLCFVDADSQIHEDTFNAIDALMQTGHYAGGATDWRPERTSPGIRCTELFVRTMLSLLRVSAGTIFCQGDIFREIGGYNEERRYAEDMEFFMSMRRLGAKRGLKTALKTDGPTIFSTRKFDRHGDWHMLWILWWIPLRYGSMKNLVQAYWYDDKERF